MATMTAKSRSNSSGSGSSYHTPSQEVMTTLLDRNTRNLEAIMGGGSSSALSGATSDGDGNDDTTTSAGAGAGAGAGFAAVELTNGRANGHHANGGTGKSDNVANGSGNDATNAGNNSNDDGGDRDGDGDEEVRRGTISSARFNILSTMVGGGSLSLPLSFSQAGNAFVGPVSLVIIAATSEFCMRCLVSAGNAANAHAGGGSGGSIDASGNSNRRKGATSFESITKAAFGQRAYQLSGALVSTICFFAVVGYAVLLRDLLEPAADYLYPPTDVSGGGGGGGPTLARNVAMFIVVLAVTPLCLLTNLTALKNVGAASMMAVLTLGICIAYRSGQCNLSSHPQHDRHSSNWIDYLTYVPTSFQEFADAFPIFVSCFICHYNVPPVHNELVNPTPQRVNWWLRSTVWSSAAFYLLVGFTGSMYGNCTPTGTVQGNVLLDFDEDDVLLLIGRGCLALTIALAFPMLVIPPRDIVLRALDGTCNCSRGGGGGGRADTEANDEQHASPSGRRHRARSFDFYRLGLGTSWCRRRRTTDCDSNTANDDDHDDGTNNEDDPFRPVNEDLAGAMTQPLLLDHGGGHFDPNSPQASKEEVGGTGGGGDGKDGNSDVVDLETAHSSSLEDGSEPRQQPKTTAVARAVAAIVIFWSGTAVASTVRSIDIVWDLLGSSLSICLGFLIPCGSYLALCPSHLDTGRSRSSNQDVDVDGRGAAPPSANFARRCPRLFAWLVILVMVPMMIICTTNAAYNTFFRP